MTTDMTTEMAADLAADMDSADDTTADYLWTRRQNLKLRALSNRLYQQDRARVHELREGAVKAASLIAGSVALANVVDQTTIQVCVSVIFAGTAASLVFGWGVKARDAARRAAEWTALDADIDEAGERTFTEANLDHWAARCSKLEAGEPSCNQGMWQDAFDRACRTLAMKPDLPGQNEDLRKFGFLWRSVIVP